RSPTPSSTASSTTPIASSWPARACASGIQHREIGPRAMAGSPNPRRDEAVDNDGLRYSAMEKRAPPVVANRHPGRPSRTETSSHFAEAQIHARLTNPAKQNIITSLRGSRRPVADIKSEPRPASNRNQWPASYWNAWPASSVCLRVQIGPAAQKATAWDEAGPI